MPIVSNTLAATTQADGSSSNVVRLYDQDGTEYTQSFFAPAGFNIQTKIDMMIAEMNEQLAQTEFETLVGGA
jgi:hypothetical protein